MPQDIEHSEIPKNNNQASPKLDVGENLPHFKVWKKENIMRHKPSFKISKEKWGMRKESSISTEANNSPWKQLGSQCYPIPIQKWSQE